MQITMPRFAAKYPNLAEAIQRTNQLLSGDKKFFHKVCEVPAFDYSYNRKTHQPVSGAEIAPLFDQKMDITVQTYRPWYIWSKAIACSTPGRPTISFNERKLNRDVNEIVGTLIHECVHILDTQKNLSFGHGNNYAAGKQFSAPYRIEKIAQEIFEKTNR